MLILKKWILKSSNFSTFPKFHDCRIPEFWIKNSSYYYFSLNSDTTYCLIRSTFFSPSLTFHALDHSAMLPFLGKEIFWITMFCAIIIVNKWRWLFKQLSFFTIFNHSQIFHIQKVKVVFACNFNPRHEMFKIALEISLSQWLPPPKK